MQARPTAPIPARPTTRSSIIPVAEIINNAEEEIRDAAMGRKCLDKHQYTTPGESLTPEHISYALFYISQMKNVTPIVKSAIRSAAYLIQEVCMSTTAQTIANNITMKLETSIIAAISPQIAKVLSAADKLDELNVKLDTNIIELSKNVECMNSPMSLTESNSVDTQLRTLAADTTTIKDAIDDLKLLTKAVQPQGSSPYCEALLSQNDATTTHQQNTPANIARAHSAVKEHQILLDPDQGHPRINSNTTKEEMIGMLKEAIASVETIDSPPIQIKSLAHLRNQGIVLELNSPEAVMWVKNPLNKLIFIEQLGGNVQIKDRLFNIVVPFLLISTDISDPATLRNIEHENDIDASTVMQVKWIKDPSKRDENQRVAHALITLTSPEAANKLLKDSLYINMDRLQPHKDKKEPIRCLKCQRLGHMAKSCLQEKDTCSTCAGEHRVAYADRHCPQFIKRCTSMDERTPENSMPYFPMEEAWTQVLAPPKPTLQLIKTRPPPSQPRPPAQQYLWQTTLGEAMTFRNTGPRGRGQVRHMHGGRGGPPLHSHRLPPPAAQPTPPTHPPNPIDTPAPAPTPAESTPPATLPHD
ncbi:hypothetical protein BKA83DRAFT_4486480 [Pisolithus microcarpus]|nr:hypothetical protein BKA83DRAFT_4486480 [Pisolithus microcarpus]